MSAAGLRLGLIGAGPWGRNYISTIAALDGVALTWIASANPETKSLAPGGCTITQDWRDVADSVDLDGVIVATPPATHLDIAGRSVAAGRAVMIEKPLTLDPAGARSFLAAARQAGAIVLVDHTYLFHPAYRRLKELAREFGPVRKMVSRAGNWGPFRADTPVLWDWGAHDVAMAIDLMGAEPRAVRVERTQRRALAEGLGESFSIELAFPAVTAEISISNILDDRVRVLELELADGAYVFDDGAQHALSGPNGPVPCAETPPLTQAVADFAAAIKAGGPHFANLELGVAVTATLARCQESIETA